MSAFLLGVPDNGILGLRDMVDHARHAATRAAIPIQLDADTGFGEPMNVARSVAAILTDRARATVISWPSSPV